MGLSSFIQPLLPPKIAKSGEIPTPYSSSRSSKVIDLGVNGKPICDFLLVINCNYSRICYRFYRAMHFSAKRGIAIACRLSVRLSVLPSVRPSVTLVNCDHIGWNSSKIISPLISLGRSLFATPTRRVCSKRNTPKFSPEQGWGAEKVAFGVQKL